MGQDREGAVSQPDCRRGNQSGRRHPVDPKGHDQTDDEKADLYVGYQIAVDQEKHWNAYGMGGSPRWDGMRIAMQSNINVGNGVSKQLTIASANSNYQHLSFRSAIAQSRERPEP